MPNYGAVALRTALILPRPGRPAARSNLPASAAPGAGGYPTRRPAMQRSL